MLKLATVAFQAVLLLSAPCSWSAFPMAPAPDTGLRAGLGASEILADSWTAIAGYGGGARRKLPFYWGPGRHLRLFRAYSGKLDPLRAKALVIESSGERVVFVSLDQLMAPADLVQRLTAELKNLGFAEDHVLISATHTHSGSGQYSSNPLWAMSVLDFLDAGAQNRVVAATLAAVRRAMAALTPAVALESKFETHGLQKNRSVVDGPVDSQARVLYLRGVNDGPWLGALINYGIHGTSLGPDDLFLSSDVPGSIERAMESSLAAQNQAHSAQPFRFFEFALPRPASVAPVAIFVSSAAGDVNPSGEGYDFTRAAGPSFAKDAMQALAQAHDIGSGLRIATRGVSLNDPRFDVARCPSGGAKWWWDSLESIHLPAEFALNNHTELKQLQLGSIHFATWPGELTVELGANLRKELGEERDPWILALSQDYLAYFVGQAELDAHGPTFESCLSPYGPTGAAILLHEEGELLHSRDW